MSWDSAVGELKTKLPYFNNYLLRRFRQEQVESFPDFVDGIFKEVVLLFNGDLEYKGYVVCSPEQRVDYTLTNSINKGRINVLQNEMQLYRYMFEYHGEPMFMNLYIPYIYNGALIINDTEYRLPNLIDEQVMSRVADGVIIKAMRIPLKFSRTLKFPYKATNGVDSFYDTIVTCNMYSKKTGSNSLSKTPPILLYLLARFGMYQTLNMFGFEEGQLTFVSSEDKGDVDHLYFEIKEDIFLKIEKPLMDRTERTNLRFVASCIYILKNIKRIDSIAEIYTPELYIARLSKLLHSSSTKDAVAFEHAKNHLNSAATFLDKYTKEKLALANIHCNDVYDLLLIAFDNIDSWLAKYASNDLFCKRLNCRDLLMKEFITAVFHSFYNNQNKKAVTVEQAIKNYRSALKLDVFKIPNTFVIEKNLRSGLDAYNDNDLISYDIKRVRINSSTVNSRKKKSSRRNIIEEKEYHFHISFLAIESVLFISQSSPGASGDINPYAQVDEMGRFHREEMPWVSEMSDLEKVST